MKNELTDHFEFQELLRRKASGALSPEEEAHLKTWIASSADAAEEDLFSRRLTEMLAHRELFEVAGIVADVTRSEPHNVVLRTPRNGRFGTFLFVFFVMLTGLGVWSAYRYWSMRTHARAVAAPYIQPLENVLFMPPDRSINGAFAAAMDDYDHRKYERAVRRLRPLFEREGDANAGLYLGISLLMERRYREASAVLNRVSGVLEEPGQEAALWYAALAELSMGNIDGACSRLEQIPDEGVYGEKARELFKKIAPQQ